MLTRRSLLVGLMGGALAAPAIVRASSLMKIWVPPIEPTVWVGIDYAPGPDMTAIVALARREQGRLHVVLWGEDWASHPSYLAQQAWVDGAVQKIAGLGLPPSPLRLVSKDGRRVV